jgi:TPR repeat protein
MPIYRIAVTCIAALAISAPLAFAEPAPGQREAAEAGDVRAQYALGIIYDTGSGVEPDFNEGFKWFQMSAEGGYAPAQAKMGLMLLYGWQVRRDVAEAARWYELAARQGDARSQAQISSMYARGQGVPLDLVAAYKWLGVAAKAGDAQSMDRLPRLARQLSEAELAEAEALVKAWRPGR